MVVPCNISGKQGFMWDESGVCYTGPDARERAFREGFVKEMAKRRKRIEFNYAAFNELSQEEFAVTLRQAQLERDGNHKITQSQMDEAVGILIDYAKFQFEDIDVCDQ